MSNQKMDDLKDNTERQLDTVVSNMTDISERAIETSKQTVDKSVEIAKKYPVHTAIGMGAVGFIAGAITNRLFK